VPVFKSNGHFTQTIIPREMDLAGLTTSRTDASGPSTVHLCRPVGGHPEIPSLVEVLLLDACATLGVSTDNISALIVGHGGKTSSNSEAATDRVVITLRENNKFGSVHGLFLEQEPNLDDWRGTVEMNNVVAVPFLIGGGGHEIEIPDRMGSIDVGRLVVTVPVGEMSGISQLIIDQVTAHPASGIQHNPAQQVSWSDLGH